MMPEKIESKEKILLSAKTEFAEKGYSGARMGAISKGAGVNQALLHYYFETKEKLYLELIHMLFGMKKTSHIQNFTEKLKLSPAENLFVAIYLLVNIHFEASDPDSNKIIAREIAEGRTYFKLILNEYFIPKLNNLEKIIIEGVKKGVFETRNSFLSVINIILFIISFQTGRDNYSGTELYDRLYGKNMKQELLDYLLENTFKSLTPKGKIINIPKISDEIIKSLDNMIENIKNHNLYSNVDLSI